jgi:hypothetical protein
VILAAERSASPRLLGTMRAAISRLPWSLTRVYGFVRMRRAYNSERTSLLPLRRPEDLSAALVHLRDRIDSQVGQDRSSPLLPFGWKEALSAVLRRGSVMVWLLLMAPSVMWFIIGGSPQTAALQKMMMQPLAWKAIVVLSVLAQTWLAWRVVNGLRAYPTLWRFLSGDDAALFALRVACGVGAVALGGHALLRAFSGFSPNSSLLDFHATDAYGSATPATGLQLANGSVMALPPGFALKPGGEGAGAHSGKLPPGFAFDDGLGAKPGSTNIAPRPPITAPAASELPPNPYDDEATRREAADDVAAAAAAEARAADARVQENWYDTRGRYEAARDEAAAAHAKADEAAAAAKALRDPAGAAADEARVASARAEKAWYGSDAGYNAAKDQADAAAAHASYLADLAAARAADAAARTADLNATPHAVADVQAAAEATAKALAAKAAARAADPNALANAAPDVQAAANEDGSGSKGRHL